MPDDAARYYCAPFGCVRRVGAEFVSESLAILHEATAWSATQGLAVWDGSEVSGPEMYEEHGFSVINEQPLFVGVAA